MSFEEDLERFARKAKDRADTLVKKVVFEVSKSLVLKSPVGDASYWINPAPKGYVGGRFRGDWQYGLNAPLVKLENSIDPTGQGSINRIVGKIPDQASGKIHYITNSQPYGKRLEEGWSRQAPNGMVELTKIEFQPIVNEIANSLNE